MKSLTNFINESQDIEYLVLEAKKSTLTDEEIDLLRKTFGDRFEEGSKGSCKVKVDGDDFFFTFGKNDKGYWIRSNKLNAWATNQFGERIMGVSPLNYDKKTKSYTFETFQDAFTYFMSKYVDKYGLR